MCVFSARGTWLFSDSAMIRAACEGYNSSMAHVDWDGTGNPRLSTWFSRNATSQLTPFLAVNPSSHRRFSNPTRWSSYPPCCWTQGLSASEVEQYQRKHSILEVCDQVPFHFWILWSSPRLTRVLKPKSETRRKPSHQWSWQMNLTASFVRMGNDCHCVIIHQFYAPMRKCHTGRNLPRRTISHPRRWPFLDRSFHFICRIHEVTQTPFIPPCRIIPFRDTVGCWAV